MFEENSAVLVTDFTEFTFINMYKKFFMKMIDSGIDFEL